MVKAYQDTGFLFNIINSHPSRVTSDIVISIQTQVTGRYIGKQELARRFFELWPERFTPNSQRSRLDIQKGISFSFFFGDISQNLDRVFNEEPDVGAKRRHLSVSNGRLCAGGCEKIPRTFAHSVSFFNTIVISSLVYPCVCWCGYALRFVLRTPPTRNQFRPWRHLWRPRICTFIHLCSRPTPFLSS